MLGRHDPQPPADAARPPEAPREQEASEGATERRIQERTADLKARVDALEATQRTLQESARNSLEFLSRLGHELRTPLSAILGFSELLMAPGCSTSDVATFSRYIHKGGEALLHLVEDVLDIVRLQSGTVQVASEPVGVDEVLLRIRHKLQSTADQAGITLEVHEGPASSAVVNADAARLQQILVHLVKNAIRYNRPQGRVDVFCEIVDGHLRFCVEDSGPGLTPEQLARLFAPFERLDAGRRGIEGTGLGLALSLALATAMKGKVGVESELGRGSRFWVALPLWASPQPT